MGKFAMKIHESAQNHKIVAVSDASLVGKTVTDEKLETEFTISQSFYGDEQFDESSILEIIKSADNLNLFGDEIVDLAIRENVLKEANVIKVGGFKHAQLYKL